MSKNNSETSEIKTMKRSLTNTHIQLIALGGTIGTGLFLGVGNSIELAGPAVIFIYCLVGFFLFLLMRALGELILSDIKKNTYIDFITEYLGKSIGTTTGYLYWFSWLTLAMAEITALGIYFQYWWPNLQSWIPGLITLLVLLSINLISARVFGNLEFSFAIIKIVIDGGIFAKGPKGFLLGFQMVIFSFIGVELIGLTAAEAKEPKKTITRAIDQLPIRIILFYVLAILSILLAIPWDKVSTSSSPFVQALGATGIKNAGSIINFVVISAAISSTNSFIYSAGRLLFSINYKGKTKLSKHLGKLDRRQLPKNALIFSTILIALAPLLNFFLKDAFTFISATATSMFLVIWSIMIITHMTYRKKTPENELPTFKMPLYPLSDVAVLTFFLAMIIILLIFPNYRIPMISAGIIFAVLVCITHFIQKKMN